MGENRVSIRELLDEKSRDFSPVFLSHIVNNHTPSYGDRDCCMIVQKSAIKSGDSANGSQLEMSVHLGTHIDMPYHFFDDGQTIEDYEVSFWEFGSPLCVALTPASFIVKDELIDALDKVENKDIYDMLLVDTGSWRYRESMQYKKENIGFSPDLADYLRENFPNVRVMGFDTISVSSYTNRPLGREAHRAFLNPEDPILLLEDMDLSHLSRLSRVEKILVAPLRIEKCDGLPCTVFAWAEELSNGSASK